MNKITDSQFSSLVDSVFVHFFEDGTKLKRLSEI